MCRTGRLCPGRVRDKYACRMRLTHRSALRGGAASALALLALGCSPALTRSGYVRPDRPVARCAPAVKRNAALPAGSFSVVGRVEVGDTGFSTRCSEQDVLALMREEACRVAADVIDIEQESRPDLASTCYRAHARFLRLKGPEPAPESDPRYQKQMVASRTERDDSDQSALIWGAVIAGVVAGVVTGALVASH